MVNMQETKPPFPRPGATSLRTPRVLLTVVRPGSARPRTEDTASLARVTGPPISMKF